MKFQNYKSKTEYAKRTKLNKHAIHTEMVTKAFATPHHKMTKSQTSHPAVHSSVHI